jgi:hypothetical protein
MCSLLNYITNISHSPNRRHEQLTPFSKKNTIPITNIAIHTKQNLINISISDILKNLTNEYKNVILKRLRVVFGC